MNTHTLSWRFYVVRIFLWTVMGIWPLIPGMPVVPIFAIGMCVLLAYDGNEGRTPLIGMLVCLGIELVYGIDIGIVSGSFLLAAWCLIFLRRWLSIEPLSSEHGWPIPSLIRSIIVACVLVVVMEVCATGINAFVYGHGFFRERLLGNYANMPTIGMTIGLVAGATLLLRRADVPFVAPVQFSAS